MKVDLTLGLIAGAAQMLMEDERFAQFYFRGFHEITMDALKQWPKMPQKNERAAMRYLRRLDQALTRAQKNLEPLLHDLPSFLNFLLAEVVELQEALGSSPRAPLLDPIIEMLEQYIDTVQAYHSPAVDHGLKLADVWETAINTGDTP